MTDATPIAVNPALTPGQWADVNAPMFFYGEAKPDGSGFVYHCPDDGDGVTISTVSRGDAPNPGICIELPAADTHGLAALCLYEQPFGFTQEDVALVLEMESDCYRFDSDNPAKRLAAKIAALLPPVR